MSKDRGMTEFPTLFVVILRYLLPLDAVLAIRPGHVDFLKQHYADGTFIVSGPQVPRTGGVILARAESRAKLIALLEKDPFYTEGAAEYQVFEFAVNNAIDGFLDFIKC
jgi:uncharacterized protein YciI